MTRWDINYCCADYEPWYPQLAAETGLPSGTMRIIGSAAIYNTGNGQGRYRRQENRQERIDTPLNSAAAMSATSLFWNDRKILSGSGAESENMREFDQDHNPVSYGVR
jgi:hypothetical protein